MFQGESGIELGGNLSSGVVKTAGNDEGVPLETPDVPQDQATGRYTTDGSASADGVTVQTPRVTTLDVLNNNLEDVAGSSIREGDDTSGSGNLTVVGAWNYDAAENLELTVEDDSGLDVTDDVTELEDEVRTGSEKGPSGPQGATTRGGTPSSNEVLYPIDLSDSGTGTYTISLAGTDDLGFGQASQSTTITVTGDDDASINLDQDDVTRGEDVRFEISGSDAGDEHVVIIESDEFRDGITDSNAQRIFRNVGDTEEVGVVSGGNSNLEPRGASVSGDIDYAYANVSIDDDTGLGVGQ